MSYTYVGSTITGYEGSDPILSIPASYISGGSTIPITTVGSSAFVGKSIIQEVIFSSTIQILDRAFEDCSGITHVDLSGVTLIDSYAFANCSSIAAPLLIPPSVIDISDHAFAGCTAISSIVFQQVGQKGAIVENYYSPISEIPITIGDYAFSGCTDASGIVLPYGSVVSASAFDAGITVKYTQGLQFSMDTTLFYLTDSNFSLTATVSSGGTVMFSSSADNIISISQNTATIIGAGSCSIIATVEPFGNYVGSSTSIIVDVIDMQLPNLSADFTTSGNTVTGYSGTSTDITLPSGYTQIAADAFANASLTSVTIPEGYTTILDGDPILGNGAFFSQTSLTSVSLPSSLAHIGALAFFGCSSLTSVTFGAGLQTIGANAFDGTGLTTVAFYTGITEIGAYAFNDCILTSVQFVAGPAVTIGDMAFYAALNQVHLPTGSTFVAPYTSGGSFAIAPVADLSTGGGGGGGGPPPIPNTPSGHVACFTKGTMIRTPTGEVAVETLRRGDLVTTASGLVVPLQAALHTRIEKTIADTAPYLIPARTYGSAQPRDLILSPTHAIQIRKGVWMHPFIAAKTNKAIRQICVGDAVDYYHLECPMYFRDNLVANGCITESFGVGQIKICPYTWSKRLGGFTRSAATVTHVARA
jgi:hypothetical protein